MTETRAPSDFLQIANDRQQLVWSNYWDMPHAKQGFFYLSGNAGAWRLLVPDACRSALSEFATARHVEMEIARVDGVACVQIWFEDGSHSPYGLLLDSRQIDHPVLPTKKSGPLLIYTRDGLVMKLKVKSITRL